MAAIALHRIIADERCQPRASMNADLVDDYAECMANGAVFPPLTVYSDGSTYWLADGFHRLFAARQSGRETIDVDVKPGDLRAAILHAVGANALHGMRRTNQDKRRSVETLLEDAEWSKWSNVTVAEKCAVSESFVRSMRPILAQNEDRARLVTRTGTTYEMNTTNLGRRNDLVDDDDYPEVPYEVVDLSSGEIMPPPGQRHSMTFPAIPAPVDGDDEEDDEEHAPSRIGRIEITYEGEYFSRFTFQMEDIERVTEGIEALICGERVA